MVGCVAGEGARAGAALVKALPPLAAALSDGVLSSHCAACMRSLTTTPTACPGACHGALLYCSAHCARLDLSLHSHSGECCLLALCRHPCSSWRRPTNFSSLGGTGDLRAALRLLAYYQALHDTSTFLLSPDNSRLGGLMSNRSVLLQTSAAHKSNTSLECSDVDDDDVHDLAEELRDAARLMCHARNLTAQAGFTANQGLSSTMTCKDEILLAEEVLCQVFTNGVQIQADRIEACDKSIAEGRTNFGSIDLGIAVYGPLFSWFNHSCRPNAFYRFIGYFDTGYLSAGSRITPLGRQYGPQISVQSIRRINAKEAVCISYTDLLQGKGARKMELWRKYRFNCECERCTEAPTGYADSVLQNMGLCGGLTEMRAHEKLLIQEAQHGITEYLGNEEPWFCCQILEHALEQLVQGLHEDFVLEKGLQTPCECKSSRNVSADSVALGSISCLGSVHQRQHSMQNDDNVAVHLLHRLCLDIYMILSSSYRVVTELSKGVDKEGCSSVNLGEEPQLQICKSETRGLKAGVNCCMASAAYTLIMAGAVQHLFESGEHGLIAIAARFWLHTGEAFIRLASELDRQFCFRVARNFPDNSSEGYLSPESAELGNSVQSQPTFRKMNRSEFGSGDEFLQTDGGLTESDQPCKSKMTTDFVQSLMKSLYNVWPWLSASSLFLSSIVNPLDLRRIYCQTSVMRPEILKIGTTWMQYRVQVFMCSSYCLQYSRYLLQICCGYTDPVVTAADNLLLFALEGCSSKHFHL